LFNWQVKIPVFRSDREAADFVERADLSGYDLSGGEFVRFEMKPKDKPSVCACLRSFWTRCANTPSAQAFPISVSSAWHWNGR